MELSGSRPLTLPPDRDEHEALFEAGLTDGLPVLAPTAARVDAMLAAGRWKPHAVLLHEPTRDLDVTAHQAAVCAVLAGAAPEYFPVIGAAVEAIGDPDFLLYGPMTSTGGAAVMVIVSGPVTDRVGVHGRDGLFGPGFRPNATIGRAIRLVLMHCLLAIPGSGDRSTQGWPGKFTLCFGENVDASPWPPLHMALGYQEGDSVVTAFACGSGHSVVNHGAMTAEPLLLTFADAMAELGSFSPGRSVVVFSPEHASKIGGMTRESVQEFLYEHAVRDLGALKRCGKIEHDPGAVADWSGCWLPMGNAAIEPEDGAILVHRGWSPEDILLLVGGGPVGGHSMFFPSWSRARGVPPSTRKIHL